ncbi:MAG: elongation factor G [Syntrophomonas sp.]|uniref:elongation factor G n=1 Tax=Syntrophomonas sp. TaxID=2053627 RepID=UPI00262DBD2C|nr:elongation factor G [Syntrophomonas sp.]MDD2509771.1 elongation factor G [Syntrophomonas sp.]MDD3878826.1 elongation factor G [Syntrophomonas sp.]MDD4625736.1 elongation factor G [Syntrophomonas sp.]
MKVYPSSKIRNIALVGHGGTGKTSLAEAMIYNTGATKRLGKVDDGNTVADFYPEEIKKKITISTALVPCEYRDHKINILDTPGYSDFYFEVTGTMRVADSMLVLLSATAGVEVQTEVVWEDYPAVPKIAFINKMDRENADFYKVLDDMKNRFADNIVPVQIPIGTAENFKGIIDLLKMKALVFESGNGKISEEEIPADMMDEAESFKEALIEAAAEANDDLLSKYLEGEELNDEEIMEGIKEAAVNGLSVFVFCGSALNNIGISPLMDFIVNCGPAPESNPLVAGKDVENEAIVAQVFKTIADPYIGRLTMFRLFTGHLKADSVVYNANKEKDEKITQLLIMTGKEQASVPEIHAGDIAAVAKLSVTSTGDTLTVKAQAVIMDPIEFPEPTLGMAIEPRSKGDEDKLSGALQRLLEEDPTIRVEKNVETRQTILRAMGDTHVDIVLDKLSRKFGVDVISREMRIPYRETIKATVEAEGKHKKQSGGHGQYGHVFVKFEPHYEGDFEFAENVFGGSVPRQYFPAVEKGLIEALEEGVLAGYPVTNIKATLFDGSYHSVDSSEMAFKMAARLAFRKGIESAKPVLLEPIMNVQIEVPEAYMGDIIGDLNSRRGRVQGMEPAGKKQLIKAQVPLAEMARYTIDLKSMTQGRGKFKMEFSNYEEVPGQNAEKIIEKAKQEKEEKEK